MHHVDSLILLSSAELNCAHTQALIHAGRRINPHNGQWQKELDRKQLQLDAKLDEIQSARRNIATQN